MPEELDLKEVMATNPAITPAALEEALAVLRALREAGLYVTTYNLLGPFTRRPPSGKSGQRWDTGTGRRLR